MVVPALDPRALFVILILLLPTSALLAAVPVGADPGDAGPVPVDVGGTENVTVLSVRYPQYLDAFDYSDVLVLVNNNSAMSKQVGDYFASARGIPPVRVAYLDVPAREVINWAQFQDLKDQVKTYMLRNNLVSAINYIVTTKGFPLKIYNTSLLYEASVDEELAMLYGPSESAIGGYFAEANPYYGARTYFNRSQQGIYLVNRLTGYEWSDVKGIIDRANDTYGNRGLFVLDVDPTKDSTGGYKVGNDWMRAARTILEDRGIPVMYDDTRWYVTGQQDVMGYCSWGSNDASDTDHAKPHNTWVDGAIAETYVSTGGRTFTYPPSYGQSMIADWIRENVTGIKGYVYEPFLSACAHPDILFERYTAGFNLAESYRMASVMMGWMGVVVGDPKVSPYRDVPDLYVDDDLVVPANATPATGEPTHVTVRVRNLGGRVEGANVTMYVDGRPWVATNLTFDTFSETTLDISFRAPEAPGSYDVSVGVNDPLGFFETLYDNNEGRTDIDVQERPVIELRASTLTFMTLESVRFEVRLLNVPRRIEWYVFEFGDGSVRMVQKSNSTFHSFDQDGVYNVTAWVVDEGLVTALKANVTVTVLNRAPLPLITRSPNTALTGEAFTFSSNESSDMDGQVVSARWDLGDGNVSTGWTTVHSYRWPGEYVVRLTITDDDGATASTTSRITVGNRPPVASFVTDGVEVWKRRMVTLNASTSSDTDGRLVQYEWEFGDGTEGEVTRSPVVLHVFERAGEVSVTLTVIDDLGASNTTTSTLMVRNREPEPRLKVEPKSLLTGVAVTMEGSGSFDEDGEVVAFAFTVLDGDGREVDRWSGVEDVVTWTPGDDGAYTVRLEVTDDDGGSAMTETQLTVLNRPPVLALDELTAALRGTVVLAPTSLVLGASATDADGEVASVTWRDGLDGPVLGEGGSVTVPVSRERAMSIHVRAVDDDGDSAEGWVNLTVNTPPVAAFSIDLDGPVVEGDEVHPREMMTFDASNSTDEGGIDRYQWDFGDSFVQEGSLVSHAFEVPGTYTVTLKVTDIHGASDETTFTLTVVKEPAPSSSGLPSWVLAFIVAAVAAAVVILLLLRKRSPGEPDDGGGIG